MREDDLRRAVARRVAVQTAAAVAVVVFAVGLVVWAVYVRNQGAEARDTLSTAVAGADDVRDPPYGVLLVQRSADGTVTGTDQSRRALAALDLGRLPEGYSTHRVAGEEVLVLVRRRRGVVLVGAAEPEAGQGETDRLVTALVAASVVGVLGAGAVGALIGHRAVEPLGRALALQRRFVADASHELRTPLTVLATRAQMLRRQLRPGQPPSQQALGHVDRLVADTTALGEVVQDLLLSAELEHAPGQREPVDLGYLADDVVATFGPWSVEHGVDLAVERGDPPYVVDGVRTALRRALGALVDNAIGHEHPGGRVRVRVGPGADGEVVVAVVDDGEGLDPREAARLVQRFTRGQAAAGSGRRFGLGLALVDEVVRAHGGRLVVEGRRGQGATFALHLPGAREPHVSASNEA